MGGGTGDERDEDSAPRDEDALTDDAQTYAAWFECRACGQETSFRLSKREAAFFDSLEPVRFVCPSCGDVRWRGRGRQAPEIDAELLSEWIAVEGLAFAPDDDATALSFCSVDLLVTFALRPDARPAARRALVAALLHKCWLDAFGDFGERAFIRSFLRERRGMWDDPRLAPPHLRQAGAALLERS